MKRFHVHIWPIPASAIYLCKDLRDAFTNKI
jgi:hypothetical protein